MNKQSRESKSIKKWFLIGAATVLTILISYFTLTDIPLSDSDSLNKTLLKKKFTGNSYNWKNLFFILTGITLLPVCYLAATKKLKGIYDRLINGYRLFKSPIQIHEEIKDVAIFLVLLVASTFLVKGIYDNCCGWWNILFTRLSLPAEPLNFRNVLIGIAGVATLIFAGWRTHIANQTRILDKGRRFDERFDNAAKALSKELNESSFPAHLGAISSLRALAIDNSEDTQRCLDIICSCNEWMEEYIDKFVEKRKIDDPYSSWLLNEDNRIGDKNQMDEITLLQEKRSQEALVAVSYILEEISVKRPEQLGKLKFHNKKLCGIYLKDLKLGGINFSNACLVAASLNWTYLKQAKLGNVNFHGAYLRGTYLQDAYLANTQLQRANLNGVYLKGANLSGVNLQRAYLSQCQLPGIALNGVDLQGAYLNNVNLEGGSLNSAKLQGAYIDRSNLRRVHLSYTKLEGVYLDKVNLEEALLISTQLQGGGMIDVNLSHAMLLSCNLYGTILSEIKSENIMFNNITDIGYIEHKDIRKQRLDDICQFLIPKAGEEFKKRMEVAQEAMENKEEPNGLDIIKTNSIVTKDSQGMYDISDEHLDNLQERLEKMVKEEGIQFLYNMDSSMQSPSMSENKNVNLVNKIRKLIDQLSKSSRK